MSSARTAERLGRILAMVPWVIAHPGATVDEVCRRFDYTRSDLVRDLDLVFVCGLPGYGPGDLMEAYLDGDEVVIDMADYFRRPVALTAVEALMLLASGMAILSAGTADPALQSGVTKLATVLLPDPGVIDVGLPELDDLGLLRTAAAQGDVVRIEYVAIASGSATVRDIEPWRVFSALGNWYVSAHCRMAGGERLFRVDRIRHAAVTGDRFAPPQDPPAPGVRYTPGADDVVVRIALDPSASWVAEYYPVREVGRDGSGLIVEFAASDPAVTARLLLRLGVEARLLDGGDAAVVRRALGDMRSRILTRYR
jgi:proteasome accessory factor C